MFHHMRRGRLLAVGAAIAASAMGLAACSSSSTPSASSSSSSGGITGSTTVNVWTSMDQAVVDGVQKQTDVMAAAKGITIKWNRVDNINQVIMTKLNAADKPDIALIPQPGVVADMVSRGAGFPLNDVLDMNALQSSMIPGTLDAGTINGKLYGLLVSANVKSLVWYNKPAWDAAGYQIPKSIDELNALTDQIRNEGKVPWCMGIESGTATGWPATDWFEDLVMRYGGADQYNQWVKHQIPFNSDLVKKAAAEFETLMFTKGNVLGGRDAIASTTFGTAGTPMFDKTPGCWMYKQGSFITGFFPQPVQDNLAQDVGVFGFPPATAGGDNPVLGGGDMAVMLNDSDAAKIAMNILADKELGIQAAGTSSFISPHKDFDTSLYDPVTKQVAEVAYNASAFLFDGSDQMPGVVGAGTFWTDMTKWIQGDESLDTALSNIDASWPSS